MVEKLKAKLAQLEADKSKCLADINSVSQTLNQLQANMSAYTGAIEVLQQLIDGEEKTP